jgi:hypothetical protein
MKSTATQLPPGRSQRLPISALWLDPDNPRLPEVKRHRTQEELIKLLADDYSLSELGRSLADNGYFSEEPLAGIRRTANRNEYTIIEGNRRLAALKLLTDSNLRDRLELTDWNELASRVRFDLSEVPVITYDTRDALLTFMGFRHITGVKPWEPLAKARFIHGLIEKHDMDFQEAARRVGSKANAIRQQYIAYRVYLQARELKIDVSGLERAYGVFTRAMVSAPLREHMGITSAKERSEKPKELRRPVPAGKAKELREFVSWVGGTKETKPVIAESREITTLGEVVASPEALKVLRATRSLDAARQLTQGEEVRLLTHIRKAALHLDEALKDAHRHRTSAILESALTGVEDALRGLRKVLK